MRNKASLIFALIDVCIYMHVYTQTYTEEREFKAVTMSANLKYSNA